MARALLRMTTRQLAEGSGVSKDTVMAIEAGRKIQPRLVAKLSEYLETKGVFFIPALNTMHREAVALRWDAEPPADDQDDAVKGGEGDDEALRSAAWDEEEAVGLSPSDIDELRHHWSEPGRWERLSEPSRKALGRVIGQIQDRP